MNPFLSQKQEGLSLEKAFSEVFLGECSGGCPEGEEREEKEEGKERGEKTHIDEKDIIKRLGERKGKVGKKKRIEEIGVYNRIKAVLSESLKTSVEWSLGNALYYQSPETHLIRKEDSNAFRAVFLNWRRAIVSLFSRFKRNEDELGFFVCSEETLYFFHRKGYLGCRESCCEGEGPYRVRIRGRSMREIEDSMKGEDILYAKKGEDVFVRGKSVLYLFDGILNGDRSSSPLPLILSKTPFLYGILTRPQLSLKSIKREGGVMYYAEIEGWLIGREVEEINEGELVECGVTRE
jgi:Domain of unknown function (DUF5095)